MRQKQYEDHSSPREYLSDMNFTIRSILSEEEGSRGYLEDQTSRRAKLKLPSRIKIKTKRRNATINCWACANSNKRYVSSCTTCGVSM